MAVSQLERANRAWPVLVKIAKEKRTATYGELGAAIGIHHRTVRFVLGVIQSYCMEEGHKPLTILIVNASGKPGTGFIAHDIENFQEGLEEVWSFDWKSIDNPFGFASSGESADSLIKLLTSEPQNSSDVYSLIKSRGIKQTLFRDALVKIYSQKCAFTEISFLEGLEACHIVPWSISSNNEKLDVRNGILLNSFHHKLFDKGLMTIDCNHTIVYSDPDESSEHSEIESFLTSNLHGKRMRLPFKIANRPHEKYIAKHHELQGWDI
jgi:putative restriction endonuclease